MLTGVKIAVTGSAGFLGSHLVNKLSAQGAEVLPVSRSIGVDITAWEQVSSLPTFDILIHLAAKTYVPDSYANPREFYSTNIVGTLNALELCRRHKARMIYASAYVYGTPDYLPIDEGHSTSAFNPYSESKIIGEQLCESYYRDFGVGSIVLRPFNIFGPGQDGKFLIPTIIEQARNGNVVLQNPEPKRDFIYIDDVVNAFVKAVEYQGVMFRAFNIASGKSHSVREIVGEVASHFDRNLKVRYTNEKRGGEIMDTVANIDKAKHELGWEPGISLTRGICLSVHESK